MNKLENSNNPDFIYHSKPNTSFRRHTIVGIMSDDQMLIGYSATSDKDSFNKKLGIKIASGRANKCPYQTIKVLNRDKKEMKLVFHELAKKFPTLNPKAVVPKYTSKRIK